jgi:acetate kinase
VSPEPGGARTVLVINAGSSSLKYQLIDTDSKVTLASGLIERIGEAASPARHVAGDADHRRTASCPDHVAAFALLLESFEEHGPALSEVGLFAIGHRVVHGGAQFTSSVLITDEVVDEVRRLIPLAPLHNPGNLEGIEVARRVFGHLPQVAVFDTAFHQTMPPAAYTYAVPEEWREQHRIRRYGFHGTSHAYVSRRAAALLGRAPEDVNVIVLHLGNGVSLTAVEGGRSVETSMGVSPLEGLVMGTRSGDVDPALGAHLARTIGMTTEEYDHALNRQSGLVGLTGSGDFRELVAGLEAGDPRATLAFDVVVHRLVKYVGAYAAVLGRVDALAFTAGIGEHSPQLRAAVLERLGILGVELDADANADASGEALITTASSRVAAYVVPTAEELEIANQTAEVVALPAG